MGAPFNLACMHRQQGLATVERLDLRLLVHAQEQSPFDRAAAINTLYLWPGPIGGLREILRVTKPEGRLLLACIGSEAAGATRALRREFRVAVLSGAQVEGMHWAAGFAQVRC
jgi:SAM-dependent methyltransferase